MRRLARRCGLWVGDLLGWLSVVLKRHGRAATAFALGVFMGRFVNELSPPGPWDELVARLFSLRAGPSNVITIAALVLALAIPVTAACLRGLVARRSPLAAVASVVGSLCADPGLRRYGTVCVDQVVTLQLCPFIFEGWAAAEVRANLRSGGGWGVPENLRLEYQAYMRRNRAKHWARDDRVRFSLVRNPLSFTDSPLLNLELRRTTTSVWQFMSDWEREQDAPVRMQWIDAAMRTGDIPFPNVLCLHVVVTTSDDRVLLTQRSSKVAWHPGAWSCSLEESLCEADMDGEDRGSRVLRWAQRAIREELGLQEHPDSSPCPADGLRVLSVFVEGDPTNVGLCLVARLGIDHTLLSNVLRSHPRDDYEFADFTFVDWSELARELRQPTRTYHPTSRYRMLLAILHNFGLARLDRVLTAGQSRRTMSRTGTRMPQ